MTKEEIKRTIPMREVLSRYGTKVNNRGFCNCPFHADKTASMKVWNDHVYCFGGCQERLDQIDFVQKMENLTFLEAFAILGGTTDELTEEQKKSIAQARKKVELEREKEELKKHKRSNLACLISACRKIIREEEPYSDYWCFAQNKLSYAIGRLEDEVLGK